MKKRAVDLPIRPKMCKTCPFRAGGWKEVRPLLEERALSEATPICHSTGKALVVHGVRLKAHLCRGARNFQLEYFHRIGFIEAATDEAWEQKVQELGIRNGRRNHKTDSIS